MKRRLDDMMVRKNLAATRSQAASLVRMGQVRVNKQPAAKAGFMVGEHDKIKVIAKDIYVSRAGHKLASAAQKLSLDFKNKTVLDVGSSTGGFTDYALRNGASKVIAVDVGTDQLHPSLQGHEKIELHEKTDVRELPAKLTADVDIVVIDVSFISLRDVLPSIKKLLKKPDAIVVAMVKPQFEAGGQLKYRGVIKNDTIRRKILKDFEIWVKRYFFIVDKADSEVSGKKGNTERFYRLTIPRS